MARVEFEDFADKEVIRIYIAGRLSEAALVEETLTRSGVDYAVDVEEFCYVLLGLFPSQLEGVSFWVLSRQALFCVQLLRDARLTEGLDDDGIG